MEIVAVSKGHYGCDNAIRERARVLGVVALLEKPIEFSALMAAIDRCVDASAG